MSSDLISKNKLLENIRNWDFQECPVGAFESESDVYKTIKEAIDTIKEQPTAYDVEKIVEQLKDLKTYKLNLADAMLEIMRRVELGNYVCLEDVIEIVKSGGVADE